MKKRKKYQKRKRISKDIPNKVTLRKHADALWSIAVRSDWAWKCAACQNTTVEAHHIFPRQHQATRYVLRNGIALCALHHKLHPEMSPHGGTPDGWRDWLKKYQHELYFWYKETEDINGHKAFDGTTNADYYIETIKRLKEYVDEDAFVRIVGVKFSRWLEESE